MPTRFWGDAQRARYGMFPDVIDEDDLARCFHLDARDHAIIEVLRGAHNRLGFGIQLGTARYIGVFPSPETVIPSQVIDAITNQLDARPAPSLDAYWAGRQRWRHVALIKDRYDFRDFTSAHVERFRLMRWLYALCLAGDDRPGLLMDRAIAWLLAERVLLPGVSTVERLCARIRSRVRERRWHSLAKAFDAEQSIRVSRLLGDSKGAALIDDLRRGPQRMAPGELMSHLERIDAIREENLAPAGVMGVPDAVVEKLARSARKMRPTALLRLPDPRRPATLAALFSAMEGIALDEAIELFDQLITQTTKDAAKDYTAKRMRSLRDLDAAALILARVAGLALIDISDEAGLLGAREELVAEVGAETIAEAIKRTNQLARPPDDRHFEELCTYWRRVMRLFKGLLQRVEFNAAPNAEPIREALEFLSNMSDWTRSSMRSAPIACISPGWSRHVFEGGTKHEDAMIADNRAYVFAVLEAMGKALKRRDIFIPDSVRYADPTFGMLDGTAWNAARPAILRALGRSEDAKTEVPALISALDSAYKRTIESLPSCEDVQFDEDGLVISPLDKLEEPPDLIDLRRQIHDQLPKGDLPDILLEVFGRANLPTAFTRVTDQAARVDDFEISLAAVLVAEGCNIGFEPMIRPEVPALRRDRLS